MPRLCDFKMMHDTDIKERAFLVVVKEAQESWAIEDLAFEFKDLVLSAGTDVEDLILIKLRKPMPTYYIGKGKLEEVRDAVEKTNANVVIFNSDLSYTQQRNLEEALELKTLDRTQLILDIFAKHARTQEGILQVELAQLSYLLPRLKGKGIMLSRLGGGIGTRGPGEKKLEVDRRVISDRITRLKKELTLVKQHRDVMRKKREKKGARVCSLVGYTNAGKSTLFNALAESGQTTSSTLFTTLDTVSRGITLHKNLDVIISDTVGFIYKLPPNLIEAFKGTLEELQYADVLLHVIDASNKDVDKFKKSVDSVLEEIGFLSKPTIIIFNKIDKLSSEELDYLKAKYPQDVFISAIAGVGVDRLREVIYERIFHDIVEVVVRLPFNRMDIANYLHNNCEVLKTAYQDNDAVYCVRVKKEKLAYLEKQNLNIERIGNVKSNMKEK